MVAITDAVSKGEEKAHFVTGPLYSSTSCVIPHRPEERTDTFGLAGGRRNASQYRISGSVTEMYLHRHGNDTPLGDCHDYHRWTGQGHEAPHYSLE